MLGTEHASDGICRRKGGKQVGKEMALEWQSQDPNPDSLLAPGKRGKKDER